MKCSHCPKKFKNDGALRRHKLHCAILCGDNTEHLETPYEVEAYGREKGLLVSFLIKWKEIEEELGMAYSLNRK